MEKDLDIFSNINILIDLSCLGIQFLTLLEYYFDCIDKLTYAIVVWIRRSNECYISSLQFVD